MLSIDHGIDVADDLKISKLKVFHGPYKLHIYLVELSLYPSRKSLLTFRRVGHSWLQTNNVKIYFAARCYLKKLVLFRIK
jgi:hypothetical protein